MYEYNFSMAKEYQKVCFCQYLLELFFNMLLKYDHKMTINEMRRLDLIDLRKKIGWRGSLIAIEKMTGIDAGYLGRCCLEEGKESKRNIGNKILDKLDDAYPGWREREFNQLEKHHTSNLEEHSDKIKEKKINVYESSDPTNMPRKTRSGVTSLEVKFITVPVLSADQIIARDLGVKTDQTKNWSDQDTKVSNLTFAINSNIFKTEVERYGYEPETIIFIDPEKKVENGKPVLVLDSNQSIIIRHIERIGNKTYLATKSAFYGPVELDDSMIIIGAVAGTAKTY